jgi:hypothetical protein
VDGTGNASSLGSSSSLWLRGNSNNSTVGDAKLWKIHAIDPLRQRRDRDFSDESRFESCHSDQKSLGFFSHFGPR